MSAIKNTILKYGVAVLLQVIVVLSSLAQKTEISHPKAEISNGLVTMKFYLPDSEKGYYRGTRFDWSGIIYSLEYMGHQYFGEWNPSDDPYLHDRITGPVESFDGEGMGYNEAAVGEGFVRIGVGVLEKENNDPYIWNHTYNVLDHGNWIINKEKDQIEFIHEVMSKTGWGYQYIKKIKLTKDTPGFVISHRLKNIGTKNIVTEQYNHNFFVIDNTNTGPDFMLEFPFNLKPTEWDEQLSAQVEINKNQLIFKRNLVNEAMRVELEGFGNNANDHQVTVLNKLTGAAIQFKVNKPLCRMVFWANQNTLCPENFVCFDIAPGESEKWESEYSLFIK